MSIVLRNFNEAEFQGWYDRCDPQLLLLCDSLRDVYGYPINVSPVEGAVGRHMGRDARSRHNIDRWKKVEAVDLLVHTRKGSLKLLIEAAESIGIGDEFGGFGIYPDWNPSGGIHIDVRENPARWGALNTLEGQDYFAYDYVRGKIF